MATSTQWQLAQDAAARYEQILVPTILGPAARALVEAAGLREGESIVDVGCGTGAAARLAAGSTGPMGRVVGVDVNAAMVAVARSLPPVRGPVIEWMDASAYALPFAPGEFDVVLCAQTLQFLQDRQRALAEMHRVLRPAGRIALSLWCDIRENPYFDRLVRSMSRHVGQETAAGLEAAFGLSDAAAARTLLTQAGFAAVEVTVGQLELDLPGARGFVPLHVSATPMAAGFHAASERDREKVVEEMSEQLAPFERGAGLRVPFRTHLVTARKG